MDFSVGNERKKNCHHISSHFFSFHSKFIHLNYTMKTTIFHSGFYLIIIRLWIYIHRITKIHYSRYPKKIKMTILELKWNEMKWSQNVEKKTNKFKYGLFITDGPEKQILANDDRKTRENWIKSIHWIDKYGERVSVWQDH